MGPGIYTDMPFAEYLASDAASKSKLWTLHTKTPAHVAAAEDEATPEMDWGTAMHVAVLEPDMLSQRVFQGPADRRGKKWTEAVEQLEAEHPGAVLLPEEAYDRMIAAQNAVLQNPTIKALATMDGISEASGFWIDEATGLLCRMRADRYCQKLALMADLKTTADASEDGFRSTSIRFGYHCHDAMYTEGWPLCGGGEVEDFIFIVVERDPPFAHALFQFEPDERSMGSRIIHRNLEIYRHCKATGRWPGFSERVSRFRFPEWVHTKESFKAVEQEIMYGTANDSAA